MMKLKILAVAAAAVTITAAADAYAAEYIYDQADFEAIKNFPEGDYVLAADITVSGTEYIPFDFSGTLDGDGHRITMELHTPSLYSALFANNYGTVKNMELSGDIEVTGHLAESNPDYQMDIFHNQRNLDQNIGAAAKDNYGTIENVYCNVRYTGRDAGGFLDGYSYYGGLCGINHGTILSCAAELEGTPAQLAYFNNGQIKSCVCKGAPVEMAYQAPENCYTAEQLNEFARNTAVYCADLPGMTQREYIIYREKYRGGRVELAAFDVAGDDSSCVVAGDGLSLIDNSKYINDEKYYLDENGSWVKFESGYERISNSADEVLVSTLDVYNSHGRTMGLNRLALTRFEPLTADKLNILPAEAFTDGEYASSRWFDSFNHYAHNAAMTYMVYKVNGRDIGTMTLTCENRRYGYRNSAGEQIIPNKYLYIEAPFINESVVALDENKKWGRLDRNGGIAEPFVHDDVHELLTDEYRISESAVDDYDGYMIRSYLFAHNYRYRCSLADGTVLYEDVSLGAGPRFDEGRMYVDGRFIVDKRYAQVFADGVMIDTDVMPRIIEGKTMIPVRFLCEALGCGVSWDGDSETARIERDGEYMELTLGVRTAKTSRGAVELGTAPRNICGRTSAAMRDIAEFFGFKVDWDDELYIASVE